jgi:hypothetical protein
MLAGACSFASLSVVKGNPKPNIVFANPPAKVLAIRLAANVPDAFEVPPKYGVRAVNVSAWHQTLTSGFQNGFGPSFTIAQSNEARTELVLEIVRAELEFSPTATSRGVVSGVEAHLIYQARLLDGAGKAIKASAGTASAKGSIVVTGFNAYEADTLLTQSASSSVESMYEAISKEMF